MPTAYLLRRNRHYFFRFHIPLDVRRWFDGRVELRKSLKTTRYNTAKSQLRNLLYRTERLLAMMRCEMLTDEQIRKLVAEYLRDSLRDSEDIRIGGRPLDSEEHFHRLEGLDLHLTTLKEDFALGQYEHYVTGSAATVLEGAGITLSKDSDEYQKLCRELMKGLIEATSIEIERMKGNYRNEYDKGFMVLQEPSGGEARRVNGVDTKDVGQPLSVLIPEYMDECTAGGRWSERTRKEGKSYFDLFLRIVGDRGIKTLDRRNFNDYRSVLTRWPKNANKKREYRGKSVGEVLEIAQGAKELLTTNSVNQHIVYIQSFMKWAVRNGYAEADYAEGLTISTRKEREDEKREEYSREDIQRLIASPLYSDKKTAKGHPERWWIPLIGMFSGMRLNEICQLYTEDVREDEGVLVFDVNDKKDKRLKNASSRRIVPVHPVLIELGFIEYVDGLKEKGEERLWGKLANKRNGYGQDFSKWYQRYNRKHVSKDRKKVFHSFRHSTANILKQEQVDEAIIKEILGHSHGSITLGRYGKAYHVGTMLDALKKLDYGFDLDAIKR